MDGLMMDMPLSVTMIMRFAERSFPRQEIVSLTSDGATHRTSYAELFARTRQLANALARLGIEAGDRIGTLAWNDHRHLELYYAVSCSGAVCHTINPRLFPEQIIYIINDAADRVLFVDPDFVPLIEEIRDQLTSVEQIVVLGDTSAPDTLAYESLLAAEPDTFSWPELDEQDACGLCYTSGTTGNPKGVLYSHRSNLLHAWTAVMPDVMSLSAREVVLAIVPMFHVNAWGVPYAGILAGCRLILPGRAMGDPARLVELINAEGVTYSLGVPTVWLGVLEHLRENGGSVPSLERICVGGAACPAALQQGLQTEFGVTVNPGWGMTEISPLGVYNAPGPDADAYEHQAGLQGRGIFGIEMRLVDANGAELAWDGESAGTVQVRGPWVLERYFGADESALTEDGWFDTGDVASIDPDGFMRITDRVKDVIKSGGEWISSLELENIAMSHPSVREAAVIGVAHDKWGERPLLVVVLREGESAAADELRAFYTDKVASWWVPDYVEFTDELPHTATGKIRKTALRQQFSEYEATFNPERKPA